MSSLYRNQHGMNLIGQGGRIILFTLPSLVAAIWFQVTRPEAVALPAGNPFFKPLGYALLVPGLLLWAAGVIQLITGFPKDKLMTTGAYGVVRNPIYSSATFFILPAVSLLTLTWGYFVVSAFLYVGVRVFIGKEEEQLRKAFGREYEEYCGRVNRMMPWRKI